MEVDGGVVGAKSADHQGREQARLWTKRQGFLLDCQENYRRRHSRRRCCHWCRSCRHWHDDDCFYYYQKWFSTLD